MLATRRRLPPVAACLALVLLTPSVALAQHPRPTGAWRLDVANADSVMARLFQSEHRPGMRGGLPPRDGGRTGGGMGPPGGMEPGTPGEEPGGMSGRRPPGRYGRAPSDKDLIRMRLTLDLVRDAPRRIVFGPGDTTVTLVDTSGTETVLRINGPKVKQEADSGVTVETRARWKSDALIIEHKVKGGGKVTERYLLGLGDVRLIAIVEADGLVQPMAFTRRYDPVE
jgi:hypothetical protein